MFFAQIIFIVVTMVVGVVMLRPLATKVGLVDLPSARKHHEGSIPLVGGIIIFLSVTSTLAIFDVISSSEKLIYFVVSSFILVVIGVIDDYYNIKFKTRFIFQIFAVLIIIKMAGIELLSLGAILSSNDVQLGLFSTIFTIFAVIGVINSLNFSDGIDGMAASISIVAFSSIAFLIHNVQEDMFKLSIFLIIASLVFLVFNLGIFRTKLYKIFLGDAGSTYLGLAIAWLLISLSQGDNIKFSPVVALWIYSVPLMDTVSIMLRRVSNRKSPFLPDREHLHHLFLRAGYSDRQSLLIIFILSLLLSFVGILLHQNAVSERIMFFLFMMVFLIYYVLIKHSWKTMRFIKVK